MLPQQILTSKDKITSLITSRGIHTWSALIEFVKVLPYGRNSNRKDLELVIIEEKGSCSSKHALLKKVADLNNIPNVKLILGMYKMDQKNTRGIGMVLDNNSINFIPEAHCYLKIGSVRKDVTFSTSNFEKVENDIISELEIEPEQVTDFKVNYHKAFLKNWIIENSIQKSFDEIWAIREQCIYNLTR